MDNEIGAPPKTGWARLVSELLVQDFEKSLTFWRDVLGFDVAYQRAEERFAYLERREGAQIMLCQRNGRWETAPLDTPYGRGVMFQVYVDDFDDVLARISAANGSIYDGPREVWRRVGDREAGQREVFVQDPDGYLVMMAQDVGERPFT